MSSANHETPSALSEEARKMVEEYACTDIESHSRSAFIALVVLAIGTYVLNLLLGGGLVSLLLHERRHQMALKKPKKGISKKN